MTLGFMRHGLALAGTLLLAVAPGCDDEATTPAADTSTPDSADTADTADSADTSAPDTTGKVTWSQVQPIFASSCAPCHVGSTATAGSGGHALASSDLDVGYAASQLAAGIAKCAGKTVAECGLIRIQDGSMPASGECSSDPKPTKCPDTAKQALIQQWIQDGMLR